MNVLRALAKLARVHDPARDEATADPADDAPSRAGHDEREPDTGLALRFVLPPDDADAADDADER
jgi:hypothetical protein